MKKISFTITPKYKETQEARKERVQNQIVYHSSVQPSKKKYNRKKLSKTLDTEY